MQVQGTNQKRRFVNIATELGKGQQRSSRYGWTSVPVPRGNSKLVTASISQHGHRVSEILLLMENITSLGKREIDPFSKI